MYQRLNLKWHFNMCGNLIDRILIHNKAFCLNDSNRDVDINSEVISLMSHTDYNVL